MLASNNKKKIEELQDRLKEQINVRKAKSKEANEAMAEGKGRLSLETPIVAGDEEITELAYDFNELTGMEYTDAMDSDPNAQQIYRITYRQALALFAKAASKQTDKIDRCRGSGAAGNAFFLRIDAGGSAAYLEKIITAGMITHTSITDFMSMKLKRFYQVFASICTVLEKRRNL